MTESAGSADPIRTPWKKDKGLSGPPLGPWRWDPPPNGALDWKRTAQHGSRVPASTLRAHLLHLGHHKIERCAMDTDGPTATAEDQTGPEEANFIRSRVANACDGCKARKGERLLNPHAFPIALCCVFTSQPTIVGLSPVPARSSQISFLHSFKLS